MNAVYFKTALWKLPLTFAVTLVKLSSMNKRTELDKPPESDEEKIVNFLGIKQRWWRYTSIVHALLMDVYCVWYLLFGVEFEGSAAAFILHVALHVLGVSGFVMLLMLISLHTGAFLMMIHDWYREKLAARRRAMEENLLAAQEEARAATAVLLREREALQAWNARRLHALETGVPFDEPMPNGTNGAAVEQLRQEQSEFHAWYERRINAAEKGEPFDEPPPNGNDAGRG